MLTHSQDQGILDRLNIVVFVENILANLEPQHKQEIEKCIFISEIQCQVQSDENIYRIIKRWFSP